MELKIVRLTKENKKWADEIISKWLADFIISRGRKLYPAELEGFFALDKNGERVGLVTYEIIDNQCEVVTLDAFNKFQGIGSILLEKVINEMKEKPVNRLWLITTNDNLDGIRFYQRRGWTMCKVHVDALEYSRKLKPVIPKIGLHDIPMRHEIEFEYILD